MAQAHRLQIYLPSDLYLRIRTRTQQQGGSLAAFIRDAVVKALLKEPVDWENDPITRLSGAGGKGSGITDMSDNDKIDEVLYGPILVRDALRRTPPPNVPPRKPRRR